MALNRRQRLRRVGILCCHTLMNLAFYRAWHEAGKPHETEQFWVLASGNFADMTVLEWCKLFADSRSRHHWTKVVQDQHAFVAGLLHAIGKTQHEFDAYIEQMRFLRDKFIAHLDDEQVMTLPLLTVARASTIYLYNYLRQNEDDGDAYVDAAADPADFYSRYFDEAAAVYRR